MSKRQADDGVIDLTEDNDDEDQNLTPINNASSRKKIKFKSKRASWKTTGEDDEVEVVKTVGGDEVEVVETKSQKATWKTTGEEDEIEVVAPRAPVIVPASATKASTASQDDEIELVGAANVQKLPHLRAHCPEHKFDTTMPFGQYGKLYKVSTIATNSESCDMCYCYACDAPAKDCRQWRSFHISSMHSNHCCANDAVPEWVKRRDQVVKDRQLRERQARVAATPQTPAARPRVLQRRSFPNPPPAPPRPAHPTANGVKAESVARLTNPYASPRPANECKRWRKIGWYGISANHCCATQEDVVWVQYRARVSPGKPVRIERKGPVKVPGDGPFAPDLEDATKDESLTKCRKCSWWSRFSHNNFQEPANPTGSHDWCHKCGRVADPKDFGKTQAKPYTPLATDFFLGEKVIPFRLKAHDPRKFRDFKWEDDWMYDEAEMEEDLFRHRFGERPTLEMIMASIPVRREIPEKGFLVRSTTRNKDEKAASETEAMILEHHHHKSLLHMLHRFESSTLDDISTSMLRQDVLAKFERETRSGTLTVRLYLPKCAFDSNNRSFHGFSFTKLLGNWYDIFPLALSDLSGALKARKDEHGDGHRSSGPSTTPTSRKLSLAEILADSDDDDDPLSFGFGSFPRRTRSKETKEDPKAKAKEKAAMKKHNVAAKEFRDGLSMVSSSGSKILGGICTDDTSLKGCLRRYLSETLAEECFDLVQALGISVNPRDCVRYHDGKLQGQVAYSDLYWKQSQDRVSHHRQDEKRTSTFSGMLGPLSRLEHFLTTDDSILAATNLQHDLLEIIKKTSSMQGILEQLENVGHTRVPFVEGLNVELLDFQKQALQWALTREQSLDGIQSFWWAKLPAVHGSTQEIYFNPILQRFRRSKPKIVKGGFIAQEMGLGKTVLSLSLILCNPAPALPESGSPISKLKEAPSASKDPATGWNDKLYSQTSDGCPKRGSILSRGTLVVCPVSLVGQWIEEAKSKLKDPGLVYPYHGQSRKRNPLILAKNVIVVTTFQVLASDATYHAKKAADANYIAPLEQVRWWRILIDESHQMKMGNTQRSAAMMNLVADHKWLVSGTPFNNTFNDLHNQLKFLGVEYAKDIMDEFKRSAYHHIGDPSKQLQRGHYGPSGPSFGNLLFFLRSIMIRHTQKQKYRGTSTTLMSLPPKTERTLEIEFSAEEREHYASLEEAARSFYRDFKAEHAGQLSRHYLVLQQKLSQIRIASSGGRYPLEVLESESDEAELADEMEDVEGKKKRKKRKETVYSDFAFEAKLKALLKDLLKVRDEDPSSKSLVFSQYQSTLTWLQEELPKHGFQYRTLTGSMSMKQRAKALHDFQLSPPTTIFLLSMRAGAVGINLTQANRVYLMEPSFNPALERQAIGRVHRLGQKRPTLITRLVMKDSVETRIMKLRKKKQSNEASSSVTPKEEDTKPKAKASGPGVLIGNVATDRATVVGEDFDLLYGVQSTCESIPCAVASSHVL